MVIFLKHVPLCLLLALGIYACQPLLGVGSGVNVVAKSNQTREFNAIRGRIRPLDPRIDPGVPPRPSTVAAPLVLTPPPKPSIRIPTPQIVATPSPLLPVLNPSIGGADPTHFVKPENPEKINLIRATPPTVPLPVLPPEVINLSQDSDIRGDPVSVPAPIPSDILPPVDFQRGQRLAYVRPVNGFKTLYLSHLDGSQALPLTSQTNQRWPVFSYDGRQIFFASNRLNRGWELFRLSPNGKFTKRLTFEQTDVKVWDSSSRQETLFTSQSKLYAYDGAADEVRLLLDKIAVFAPCWSPDAERIAFSYNNQIVSINRNAQDFQIHVPNVTVTSRLDWDGGQMVVFDQSGGIFKASMATGQITALSNQSDSEPMWSLDGQKIVFTSQRTGPKQIFIMNANGSQVAQVTQGPDEAYSAAW